MNDIMDIIRKIIKGEPISAAESDYLLNCPVPDEQGWVELRSLLKDCSFRKMEQE